MAKIWVNLINTVRREKLMAISNVFVLTMTFLVLGIFIYIVAMSQTALHFLEQQAQVTVFFKDDFQEESILGLKSSLERDPRISAVKYVSKAEAFKIFTEINKDEPILLESITPDILPASLEIKTKSISDLSALASELSKKDGVEEIRFFKDVVERFRFWSNVVYIVGFVLVAMFLVISYSVVLATLRTTINSKGVELEIMKLVGASDSYVKTPLIMQGVFFGVISALIAGFLMVLWGLVTRSLSLFRAGMSFGFLPGISVNPLVFSFILALTLLLSGALLGYIGSYYAVKKYLKY